MARNVHVNGRRVNLKPSALVGKGGEADVYQIDPKTVLKLYKQPDDPDYFGNADAQQGAKVRIHEHQKKLPDFPKGLPARIVAPIDLAYSKPTGGSIVGYTMRYLQGMEVLLRLSDRQYREQGAIDANQIVTIFSDLHQMVTQAHQHGITIGDFNDLNVLYKLGPLTGKEARTRLVDTDSMQYGPYYCRTFTSRFLDPLRSDPQRLLLTQPHNEDSDWYAYNIMLFQCFLYVGPYGGVHKPPHGKRLQHDARVLQRISVFDRNVVYPKPALPYDRLPDELLQHFHQIYERDDRGPFPLPMLEKVRWTACLNCGAWHARNRCPECAAPGLVKPVVVIRGKVTARREFRTEGIILHAVVQGKKLRYLYHLDGKFYREEEKTVLTGDLDPELRFRINRDITLLGKGDRLFLIGEGNTQQLTTGTVGSLSIFDANDRNYFWIEGDQLRRSATIGSTYIGNILRDRTLFWVGKKYGFGFYQAGQIQRAFSFDVQGQGVSEHNLPVIPGQIVDASCVSSDQLIWFMVTTQDGGRLVNHCHVIGEGKVLATELSDETTDIWLNAGIRGHFATGSSLFVATDDGIVRVAYDLASGSITVAETFPDTEPFVETTSQLLPAPGGIYTVSPHEIIILRIQ